MATARDVVNGALRRAQLLDVEEEAAPELAAVGLASYNGLFEEFVEWGWLDSHATATLNTTVAVGAAYVEGLKALVAQRIAGDFGRQVPRQVRMDARMVLAQLANAKAIETDEGAEFEEGLWSTRPAEPYYRSS